MEISEGAQLLTIKSSLVGHGRNSRKGTTSKSHAAVINYGLENFDFVSSMKKKEF